MRTKTNVFFPIFFYLLFCFQGSSSNDSSTMNEISDVDVYFKRLYSKAPHPPPISVDEFLDIMAKCKDSIIPRERVIKIKNKFTTNLVFIFHRKFFKMV